MEKLPKAVWFIATIPIVAIVCLISMNLAVDYDYHAILIGYFLYIFMKSPQLQYRSATWRCSRNRGHCWGLD